MDEAVLVLAVLVQLGRERACGGGHRLRGLDVVRVGPAGIDHEPEQSRALRLVDGSVEVDLGHDAILSL
jgi:hypothetical protein